MKEDEVKIQKRYVGMFQVVMRIIHHQHILHVSIAENMHLADIGVCHVIIDKVLCIILIA